MTDTPQRPIPSDPLLDAGHPAGRLPGSAAQSATSLLTSPGPLGAILLAGCTIAGVVSGTEGGSAIALLLFLWLIGWAISKGNT